MEMSIYFVLPEIRQPRIYVDPIKDGSVADKGVASSQTEFGAKLIHQ